MSPALAALLLFWSAEVAAPDADRLPPPDIFPRFEFDPESCHGLASAGQDDVAICDRLLARSGISAEVQAELLASRARMHQNANRLEAAETDLTTALGLAPQRGRLYINRGNLRLSRGAALAALSDYNLAIDLTFAREPRAFYNRAFAHRALGNLQAAMDDFDTARIVAEFQLRPLSPRIPEAREIRFR